uniref:Dynamin-related protein 1 n=1 Tax=Stygiella incarcerata TaxID=1712417 RepID=A0A192ZJ09_9EUKA|nr:dynamin-related protein 1 [Stygiella incarcerata]
MSNLLSFIFFLFTFGLFPHALHPLTFESPLLCVTFVKDEETESRGKIATKMSKKIDAFFGPLEVVNRLQEIFGTSRLSGILELPRIVCIGSQSSGKSSVLEAIMGREFLPRGTGIVTRCPIVLQMNQISKEKSGDLEWVEFGHLPSKRFTDFREVDGIIRDRTNQICGPSGISSNPIVVKVFSPNVVPLTLVDLPGLTRIATHGQPQDIVSQIEEMVITEITRESSLILAVSSAADDLANSDALRFAHQVDPTGSRTIGVLTNLDRAQDKSKVVRVIDQEEYHLHFGFVGVVNRSKAHLDAGMTVAEGIEMEERFLRSEPAFSSIVGQMGSRFLREKLSKILCNRVKEVFPRLEEELGHIKRQAQTELRSLGFPLGESDQARELALIDALKQFCSAFFGIIDGTQSDPDELHKRVYGGARVSLILHEAFHDFLSMIDPCADLSDEDIQISIRNTMAIRKSLFIPEVAFERILKSRILRLKDPMMECVDNAIMEIRAIARDCETTLSRFPELRGAVREEFTQALAAQSEPLKRHLTELIQTENAYINMAHPEFQHHMRNFREGRDSMGDFVFVDSMDKEKLEPEAEDMKPIPPPRGEQRKKTMIDTLFGKFIKSDQHKRSQAKEPESRSKVSESPHGSRSSIESSASVPMSDIIHRWENAIERRQQLITPEDASDVKLIRKMILSYYVIVQRRVEDALPKSFVHFIINYFRENLNTQLITALHQKEKLSDLLAEEADIMEKRERAQERLDAAVKGLGVMEDIKRSR